MKIAGLQRVSLIDYPDCIAATVFLAGCNLDCDYCHNRWMIDASQVAPAISAPDLLAWLQLRRGRLDGVCISGGEPTLHVELPRLLHAIKELGYRIKLDTNGTQPQVVASLLRDGLLDYVAMDLKAPLDARYEGVVGKRVDLQTVQGTMSLLRGSSLAYEYRTTVLPSLDQDALRDIAAQVLPLELWYLQRFVPAEGMSPTLAASPPTDESALQMLADALRPLVPRVHVRGMA